MELSEKQLRRIELQIKTGKPNPQEKKIIEECLSLQPRMKIPIRQYVLLF